MTRCSEGTGAIRSSISQRAFYYVRVLEIPTPRWTTYDATSVALVGAPALAPQDWVKYPFRASVSALFGAYMPTGSYEPTRLLNLGTNRWTFRFAAPIIIGLGDWKIGKRTTFEVVPNVYVFTDNNDITAGDSKSQDPLFVLETHLTRDLSPDIYVSLDMRTFFGGETSVDGVPDENQQQVLALGGTFGWTLTSHISLQVTYAEQVVTSPAGLESRMFRFRLPISF